jgi:hypothetical protein
MLSSADSKRAVEVRDTPYAESQYAHGTSESVEQGRLNSPVVHPNNSLPGESPGRLTKDSSMVFLLISLMVSLLFSTKGELDLTLKCL